MFSVRIRSGLLLFLTFLFVEINGAIINVNGPDSTFTSIQPAINASSHYDTVLVYPGTYYENLVIEWPITLASLHLLDMDPMYIDSTIIDGDFDDRCIQISQSYGDLTTIWGFTIIHGAAKYGGGIDCIYNIRIMHCIIRDNKTTNMAGGIYCRLGQVYLKDVRIIHNQSLKYAGGAIFSNVKLVMDFTMPCSIFDNYAPVCTDLSFYDLLPGSYLEIDTFSVIDPDRYFISNHPDKDSTVITIRRGKHSQVSADLFVSPGGNDTNSGTTASDPLRSLHMAMLKIRSNPDTLRTIRLFPGTYSPGQTGEHFPMGFKNNILLKGPRKEECFIDGDSMSYIFFGSGLDTLIIRDLSIRNGTGERHPGQYLSTPGLMDMEGIEYLRLSNISLSKGYSSYASAGYFYLIDSLVMDSVEVHDNFGSAAMTVVFVDGYNPRSHNYFFRNCRFYNNQPMYGYYYGNGGALLLNGYYQDTLSQNSSFINCEFHHNETSYYLPGYPSNPCIRMRGKGILNLVNTNFIDNKSNIDFSKSIIRLEEYSRAMIHNCIFFDNEGYELSIYESDPDDPETNEDLVIYHSLLENGSDSIFIYDTTTKVHYSPTNIEGDPLLINYGEYPYQPASGSPCRDAGTLNLPPGIQLPDIDLAGNSRIFNDTVDMGAYEYNEFVNISEIVSKVDEKIDVWIYPNPFSSEIKMIIRLKEDESAVANIYSITGSKTISINIDGSNREITWDGRDLQGNPLPPGIYLLQVLTGAGISHSTHILKL